MIRILSASLVLILAATGCGSNQPPPATTAANQPPSRGVESAPANSSPAPAAVEPSPKAAPQPKTAPAAAGDPALRDLAARLVVSDGHGGWRHDEQAATDLEKLGEAGLSGLWPLLNDASADVRRGAAFALLGKLDPGSPPQTAAYAALLADPDPTIRGIALDAVKEFRLDDQVAMLSWLGEKLSPAHEDRADNRAKVARLLGSFKSAAQPVLDKLADAARSDPEAKVRTACLGAIAQIGETQKVVPILARGLADADSSVRQLAAAKLRQLGAASAPAAKELAAALPDEGIRDSLRETLIAIGEPAVLPLAEQLTSPHPAVRKYALFCLAKIGPAAKSALAAVEKCQQDSDEEVRSLAAAAVKRIGASSP